MGFFYHNTAQSYCWALHTWLLFPWIIACTVATMSNKNFPVETKFILSKYFGFFFYITIHFYSSIHLPFAVPISPLCDLPEYRWCWGAKHPLGLQQSQTEGSGGGKRREKWQTRTRGILGPTKNSTEKRRGEWWRVCRHNDEGNIGRLFLDVLRMKCFAVRTGRKKKAFTAECTFPLVK